MRQREHSATISGVAAGCRPSWQQVPPWQQAVRYHRRLRAMGLSSGLSTGSQAGPSAEALSGLARALSSSACEGGSTAHRGGVTQIVTCAILQPQAERSSMHHFLLAHLSRLHFHTGSIPGAPGTRCRLCGPAPS